MAGKIPQPFIDDLIDRSDIVEVISSRLTLKKTGKNYSACCPFHNEKTPSFSVSPQKQFYYCFGCGAGGNVIGFLMENDHLSFPEAVETLAKTAGMEIPREQTSPQAEARQRRRLDIYTELEKAADYYRSVLKQTPKAVNYLKSRGLSGEIAKQFALGYVPDEWDSLIKLCGNDAPSVQRMIDGGMLIARDQKERGNEQNHQAAPSTNTRDYYDRFRDRIMFPIRDQRGRTIAFGGRVLGNQKPKYLNSPETPVFHKGRELYGLYEVLQQRQRPDELIVVEGYMDVVALAQFGVINAVATLGTSAGTDHMDRIFRHVSKVVFCFDGDKAGRSAAQRALDACLNSMLDGRQARFLFLPEGEDPDSIVRKEGAEGFQKRVDSARTLSDFIFELAGHDLNLESADQKAMLAHNALPYISQLPKGFLQAVMLKRLADETGIGKEELSLNLVDAQSAKKVLSSTTTSTQKPAKSYADESHNDQPVTTIDYSQNAPIGDVEKQSPEEESDYFYQDYDQALEEPEKQYSNSFKNLLNLIFKHPKLALEEKLDHELIQREDHLALIGDIKKLISQNPYTTFGHLHGYWTGSRIEVINKINEIIDPKIIEDLEDEKVEDDFRETLDRFIQRQTRKDIEQQIREISATPFAELTPEQREAQRALHNQLKSL